VDSQIVIIMCIVE